jgi:hypothetical protein
VILAALSTGVSARTVYRCVQGGVVSVATAPEPGSKCEAKELDDRSAQTPNPWGAMGVVQGRLYRREQDGRTVYSTRELPGSVEVLAFTVKTPEGEPAHEGLGKIGPPRLDQYPKQFVAAAKATGVDDALLRAIAHAESAFDPKAVSPKGARGVMQLLPETAQEYGVKDPFNASQSISAGARHMKTLMKLYEGDVKLATRRLQRRRRRRHALRRRAAIPGDARLRREGGGAVRTLPRGTRRETVAGPPGRHHRAPQLVVDPDACQSPGAGTIRFASRDPRDRIASERSMKRHLALFAMLAAATCRADEAPSWPDTFVSRLEALALMQEASIEILADASATTALERWCREHRLATEPKLVARVLSTDDPGASGEQRARLEVGASEPLRYRRVELRCGERVLSVAENWYVPGRLTEAMNAALAGRHAVRQGGASARAVSPDVPRRSALGALAPGLGTRGTARAGARPLAIPAALFEHRALLYSKAHVPFAEVKETYQRDLLALPPPPAE